MKVSDMINTVPDEKADHPLYQCLNALRSEIFGFPYRDWSLEMAAQTAHISKSWFQHNYMELFSVSFQQDIISSRIRYAKNLLTHSEYTVEYIARLCGYNNDVHFMRQFKKYINMTPSVYREQFKIKSNLKIEDKISVSECNKSVTIKNKDSIL